MQKNSHPVLISAIFSADEFPWLDYIPWKEALRSVMNFADECVVVYGGKTLENHSRQVKDYIVSLKDPRISLVTFPLPAADNFNWMHHASSLVYGYLHCTGIWCLRGLMDEIFPDDFAAVRQLLPKLPPELSVVSVGRHYLLGVGAAFPYRDKQLLFRRDSGFIYGCVNPRQGAAATPLAFDDLVDSTRWFNGARVETAPRPTLIESADARERLLAGEIPHGYRDPSADHVYQWGKAFFNVDVNYYPNHFMIEQKWLSTQAYQHLPETYQAKREVRKADVLSRHRNKIRQMLGGTWYSTKAPESINRFAERHADVDNVVRRVVEKEFGLRWCHTNDQRTWKKKFFSP